MQSFIRFCVCTAVCLGSAGLARAGPCETERLPQAVAAFQAPLADRAALAERVNAMDADIAACPDHAWLNMLGAELDRIVYDELKAGNNGVVGQDAYNYLGRALERSAVFHAGSHEDRQDRLNIQTGTGRVSLTYSIAADTRRTIIRELAGLAKAGTLHPYLAGGQALTCGGWLTGDVQTLSSEVETQADLIFLPFIDAAAETCLSVDAGRRQTPIALKAQAYTALIDDGVITDPEEIRSMLTAAKEAEQAFLGGGDFSLFYSEFDARRLEELIRKHDPEAALLARDLWFTPEHMRSEKMQYSLAMALSEEWAGLAPAIDAGTETLASAGARYTSFAYAVIAEGREAGLEAETRTALLYAMAHVQEGRVRAPAMEGYDPPPQWLADTLMKIFAAKKEGE